MFRNYLKSAWRNIIRSKWYSVLNIMGFATGMTIALLIGLWVYYQYSYNSFLPEYQQVYQVKSNYNADGDVDTENSTPSKLADMLRTDFPEIAYASETDGFGPHGLKVGDKKLYNDGGQVQKDFLRIFQFPLVKGNAGSVLNDPYSIVLTESTAKALFADQDPIGKTVRFDNDNDLRVTGVLKDLPANSSFQFNYLVPFSFFEETTPWVKRMRTMPFGSGNAFQIFVKLKPGVSYAQIAPKIKNIEKGTDDLNAKTTEMIMQPIAHWHLYTNYYEWKGVRRLRGICPALWHHRSLCPGDRLHQFYQSHHSPIRKKSTGSRYPESHRFGSKEPDFPIPDRIVHAGGTRFRGRFGIESTGFARFQFTYGQRDQHPIFQ